jgi:hypothetical protein
MHRTFVLVVVVAACLALPSPGAGKPAARKSIQAEVDEAVLHFAETGHYLACGCGCCGEARGARTVCLSAETGSLREVVESDRRRARSRRCGAVGCSLGSKYVMCADVRAQPLRLTRAPNPKILDACKQRSCKALLALKDRAGQIGGYVLESSAADVPTLYVDAEGNLLGSLQADAPDGERQAAAELLRRLREALPSAERLCCTADASPDAGPGRATEATRKPRESW